jgi:hypothetical protein
MVTSKAIAKYLETMTTMMTSWGFPPIVAKYDDDLGFSTSFRKELVKRDACFKEANRSKNWIGYMWNRQMITPSEIHPRLHSTSKKFIPEAMANLYEFKVVDCTIALSFFSSSLSYLESFEERLVVEDFDSCVYPFALTTEEIGLELTLDLNVRGFEITGMTKESSEEYGSLSILETSAVINYPVPILLNRVPLILEPRLSIYTVDFSKEFPI